jgi:Fe-S-cluster containining protein
MSADNEASPCQACGACCSYSHEWPRFSLESSAALDLIPSTLINAAQSGMRCEGDRCCALVGKIGTATSCGIYALRPDVCRACVAGDPECTLARQRFGLPPIMEVGSAL